MVALLALALSACAGVCSAFGAEKHARYGHQRSGHRLRCTRSKALRVKAGSYHAGHLPRHHRGGCLRGHARHNSSHTHRPTHHRRRRGPAAHGRPALRHSRSSAADSGACADTELRPTAEDLERIRNATMCLVNRERVGRGEAALQGNDKLQAAAQAHSESMAWGGYFEHLGPGGQTPLDRMRSAGYIGSSGVGFEVGENIAWGTGALSTPRAIVAGWMSDPGHRANILNGRFHDSAIGISPHLSASFGHGRAGGVYTQDFGLITGA